MISERPALVEHRYTVVSVISHHGWFRPVLLKDCFLSVFHSSMLTSSCFSMGYVHSTYLLKRALPKDTQELKLIYFLILNSSV